MVISRDGLFLKPFSFNNFNNRFRFKIKIVFNKDNKLNYVEYNVL